MKLGDLLILLQIWKEDLLRFKFFFLNKLRGGAVQERVGCYPQGRLFFFTNLTFKLL